MGRTYARQDEQIRRSITYTDNIAAGATMESAAVNLQNDMNNIRSQLNRILKAAGGGNWYDDVATVNTKKRGLTELNTDLDDLEEHRILCGVQKLESITVPAAVYATGSITTIADSLLVDGESFTIDDGVNPAVTFEFDNNSSVVETNTLRQVVITGSLTADDVRDAIITAIGNAPALYVTASNGGAATVTLTADRAGTHANNAVTETVTNVGFSVSGLSGGAGDVVVLSATASETPSDVAAVDAGNALGAIVAVLSGDVGAWDSALVAGSSAIAPKSSVMIRDQSTHDGLTSDGRQIVGLFQAESGVANGDTFNDTDKQCQISFYRITDADTIEPCPGQDIGGKQIEYIYAKRVTLDTIPEDCGFPFVAFTDERASVTVTLQTAIDNQGATPVVQTTDIFVDLAANSDWLFRDANSDPLLSVVEGSAGGTSQVQINTDVDTFNVDAAENDFAQGIKANTSGQEIDIGVTAGTIESTGANDLRLFGAGEMLLDDSNQVGSTWAQTTGIKLSETQAEWDDFKTEFGEVSLLNAIAQAKNVGGLTHTKKVAVVTASSISADTDVGGPASANNVDLDFADMSAVTFVNDVDIYLNGILLRCGADAAANHDVYPGSTGTQLKFEFGLQGSPGNPDVITQVVWAGV